MENESAGSRWSGCEVCEIVISPGGCASEPQPGASATSAAAASVTQPLVPTLTPLTSSPATETASAGSNPRRGL